MKLQKNGVTYNLSDKVQIDAFIGKGWLPIEDTDRLISGENESGNEPSNNTNYDEMADEQLADYANHLGVDISRCRSREGIIAKLEKAGAE